MVWNLTHNQDLFCIWSIATLQDPLQDDLIKKTVQYLVKTIPVLNSKPVADWLRGHWQFIEKKDVDDLITRINVHSDAEAQRYLQDVFLNPINAEELSMIRFISIDGPSKHFFVIQVHHLVVDGEGVKRICVKFAEFYQALYQDINWKPEAISDPCRSWGQIAKNFGLRQVGLVLLAYLINMYIFIKALLQGKTSYNLAGDENGQEKAIRQPSFYFEGIVLEKDETAQLKTFTKNRQATVNDILMTSLALATKQWNASRGDKRNWLKFGYTANLRRWWGEPGGTFGNYSVVLIHGENLKSLKNPAMALEATKSKVDKVKKRVGLDAFLILMQLKALPYFLVRRLSLGLKGHLFKFLKNSHAMTNIGIIYEEAGNFGHTLATGYSFLAPTFPGGCVVYTVTTFKNETTIYLGTEDAHLSRESANRFLSLWKEMIFEIITLS